MINPKHSGYVLTRFQAVLEQLAKVGIIQKYSLDSYERELERYTPELIDACENFFCAGTSLIVEWLEKITMDDTAYKYYYIADISIEVMLQPFGIDKSGAMILFRRLYQKMADDFGQEQKAHNSMMKERHRSIRKEFKALDHYRAQWCKVLKKSLKAFSATAGDIATRTSNWTPGRKIQLFSDLLHMHLNRLFVDDSRTQEMILYYSYWRSFESDILR
jgi:thiopeptide-type bacteriocin biosynthesis protein